MAAELAAQKHFQTGATDHYVGPYTECVSMSNFSAAHRYAVLSCTTDKFTLSCFGRNFGATLDRAGLDETLTAIFTTI